MKSYIETTVRRKNRLYAQSKFTESNNHLNIGNICNRIATATLSCENVVLMIISDPLNYGTYVIGHSVNIFVVEGRQVENGIVMDALTTIFVLCGCMKLGIF